MTLTETIKKIEAAGGPKWYEWCCLNSSYIIDTENKDPSNDGYTAVSYCPPACEAAVIAYGLEVMDWVGRDQSGFWYSAGSYSFGSFFVWYAETTAGKMHGTEPTRYAAMVKMLEVVAERLEVEE